MLPEGWVEHSLDELALIERGKFSVRPRNDPRYFNGSMPFVQTGDITSSGTYLTSFSQTLNELGIKVSKVFPKDTILITIAANIGDTSITTFDVACPDSVVAIQPYEEKADVYWLKKTLETKKEDLDSQSTQNAQKNINLQVLKPLLILTPPLPEQKKIAQILSAWDKAITTTEQLIANSQQQKKALMQQLLTGKKRLLDDNGVRFSGGWEHSTLRNILTVSKGQQLNKDTLDSTGLYPVINGGITPSGYTDQKNRSANTITISEGGNSCGYVAFQTKDFWCGGHCYSAINLKLNLQFTYHCLKFNENRIMKLRVGSGLPNIQKKDIDGLVIEYPNCHIEQQKIASVLSSADREIEALQGKLTALKQEKKALMQQLLTGKRRVLVHTKENDDV